MSEVLKSYNYNVLSSDLIDRGYGIQKDFFDYNKWAGDIITNPPYKIALPFLKHALNIINNKNKMKRYCIIYSPSIFYIISLYNKTPPASCMTEGATRYSCFISQTRAAS